MILTLLPKKRQIENLKSGKGLPCWSIFRLIEIHDLCNEDVDAQHGWAAAGDFDYMEYVISRFEDGIMNFQRLGR